MHFQQVVLHNVGPFLGRHEVNLSVPAAEKPVLLFGGLNGGGKTTFLEALQIGLYGCRAKTSRRGSRAYEAYLEGLINDMVDKKEGASIEIAFREFEDGGPVDYRVVRTWKHAKSRVAEKLEVYVNELLDPSLSEHWNEAVEHFLPQKLCNLFFFDGEQIEALADHEKSKEILETAISSLLGLELVDQLVVDLQVAKRKKLKETASEEHRERLEVVASQLSGNLAEIQSLEKQRMALAQELGRAKNRLERANLQYERQGGDFLEQMKDLERKKAEIEVEIRAVRDQLRALAAGALPLGLLSAQLDRLAQVAASEQNARILRQSQSLIEERDQRVLQWMDTSGAQAELSSALRRMLEADREKAQKLASAQIQIGLTGNGEEQVSWLRDEGVGEAKGRNELLQARLLDLQDRLTEVDAKIVRVPDEASMTDLIQEREQAKHAYSTAEKALEEVDQALEKRRLTLADQEAKRDALEKEVQLAGLETELQTRVVSTADTMVQTMVDFRKQVLERHLGRLETFILESYQSLLRKQNLVGEVRICPDSLTLTLADRRGAPISSTRLSAGERQLLATSILWGLAKASGRALPVVIDTPLGRLDASHRRNLIEHYFPNASHQVVLLSTDEEIDGSYYQKLKPCLGAEYEIYYDEERGGSAIRSGYPFEEAA